MRFVVISIFSLSTLCGLATGSRAMAQNAAYTIQPGDTWAALALRYGIPEVDLRTLNPHFNTTRQPTIGREIVLPEGLIEQTGLLIRVGNEGILQTAAQLGLSLWDIAIINGLDSPYRPTFYRPLLIPGEGSIRDLPPGITSLELSKTPATAGRALGIRGTTRVTGRAPSARLDGLPISIALAGNQFAGVVGTGAFYKGGEPELMIRVGDSPAWVQPWAFSDREWEYQELTLTGTAAEIGQQDRDDERARLRELWTVITSEPLWSTPFVTPLEDFLSISANYGARRSYNGSPYLTYHEGVDYSAYGGSPVTAPAEGIVVLAEPLIVRGGAVILNHGLGIYSGYYHLSAVHAIAGQHVQPGDLLGEVGTTGLSTDNHLHWDLLVNGTWVDVAAWQEDNLACWLLEGLGQSCTFPTTSEES